jgi:hypothetical protein
MKTTRDVACLLCVCVTALALQGCCYSRSGFDAWFPQKRVAQDLPMNENFINRYGFTQIAPGVSYEECFGFALRARYRTERFALVDTVIRGGDNKIDAMLLRILVEKQFTAAEKELAACILWEREVARKKFASYLAEYYVNQLRDPDYCVTGQDGWLAYKSDEDLSIREWKNGIGRIKTYIPTRHVLPRIYQLSTNAVPYLLPLLRDKDFVVRINTYAGLKRITSLEIPYDPVTGKDQGVAEFLRKKGWPIVSDELQVRRTGGALHNQQSE